MGRRLLTERGDMMAAKLEWVRDKNGWWHAPRSCGAKGGYWSIAVNNDGMFLIAGETEKRWHTLSDAKDYCQAQEDAASHAELPKVGDVWGVPGKPETRRYVDGITGLIHSRGWKGNGSAQDLSIWQSWVRDTGAVRIDGERDAQWQKELAKFVDLLKYAQEELDAERARVRELEAKLAALEKQYQACEDKVATEFERCGRLLEALRGIEKRVATAPASWAALDAVEQMAREAIQREEGVKS